MAATDEARSDDVDMSAPGPDEAPEGRQDHGPAGGSNGVSQDDEAASESAGDAQSEDDEVDLMPPPPPPPDESSSDAPARSPEADDGEEEGDEESLDESDWTTAGQIMEEGEAMAMGEEGGENDGNMSEDEDDEDSRGGFDQVRVKIEPVDQDDRGEREGAGGIVKREPVSEGEDEGGEEEDDDEDDDGAPLNRPRRWQARVRYADGRDEEEDEDFYLQEGEEQDSGEGTKKSGYISCQACRKSVTGLRGLVAHVARAKKCKDTYGQKYDDLKKLQRKTRKADYYYQKKEAVCEKKREQYRMSQLSQATDGRPEKRREKRPRSKKEANVEKKRREMLGRKNSTATGVANWDPKAADETSKETCREVWCDSDPNSKIDPSRAEEGDGGGPITMPEEYEMPTRLALLSDLAAAHGFVGLALGRDGTTVEVRPLLAREDVNLQDLRQLLHAVAAVIKVPLVEILVKAFGKGSLIPHVRRAIEKKKFISRFVRQKNKGEEPEKPVKPEPSVCAAAPSRETRFVSLHGSSGQSLTARQLVVNFELSAADMGAVALDCHFPETESRKLLPLFAVNMDNWADRAEHFRKLMTLWLGSSELLASMVLATPCGRQAKADADHQLALDSFDLATGRQEDHVCDVCGKTFQMPPGDNSMKKRYDAHLETHVLDCRTCGESFDNHVRRKYHELTHREVHFACPVDTCDFVSKTKSRLEWHHSFEHEDVVCDLCGRKFHRKKNLIMHLNNTHRRNPNAYFYTANKTCDLCNAGPMTQQQLTKHKKRYHNPEKPKTPRYNLTDADGNVVMKGYLGREPTPSVPGAVVHKKLIKTKRLTYSRKFSGGAQKGPRRPRADQTDLPFSCPIVHISCPRRFRREAEVGDHLIKLKMRCPEEIDSLMNEEARLLILRYSELTSLKDESGRYRCPVSYHAGCKEYFAQNINLKCHLKRLVMKEPSYYDQLTDDVKAIMDAMADPKKLKGRPPGAVGRKSLTPGDETPYKKRKRERAERGEDDDDASSQASYYAQQQDDGSSVASSTDHYQLPSQVQQQHPFAAMGWAAAAAAHRGYFQ